MFTCFCVTISSSGLISGSSLPHWLGNKAIYCHRWYVCLHLNVYNTLGASSLVPRLSLKPPNEVAVQVCLALLGMQNAELCAFLL